MRVVLVRHGMCAPVGRTLAGRSADIHLNEMGRSQATKVAHQLKAEHIAAVYSSPIDRAVETAKAISEGTGAPMEVLPALTEVEFGAWTGRELASLEQDEAWKRFNTYRSGTRPPEGELALETQVRAVMALHQLRDRHAEHTIVAVSHGDVIRSVIAYLLGMPLDLQHRLEIEPGSASIVELQPWGTRVLGLNHVAR